MRGNPLRHRPSVNGVTQPVVIITTPERDALADLIDWARNAPHSGRCRAGMFGAPCTCGRDAALAALDGDR